MFIHNLIKIGFVILLVHVFGAESFKCEAGRSSAAVVFLDVGQGDSALLCLDGELWLIDSGPDAQATFKLDGLLGMNRRKIDKVFLSHPHADHISGLEYLSERYEIGEVYLNRVCYESALYARLLGQDLNFSPIREFVHRDVNVFYPMHTDYKEIGDGCQAVPTKNINNESVVMAVDLGNKVSLLFMGDAEAELERELLAEKRFLSYIAARNLEHDTVILKAGHHCSKTSSTEAFLEKVDPDLAICSYAEDNSYGHPSGELLDRFAKRNVKVKSTAQSGDILYNIRDM